MTGPARIAPLPNLPLFHKLEGRKAVVVGASEGASWKAELLAAAGAAVVRLEKAWNAEQLKGAVIAVADLADRSEALRFVEVARAAGAVVNIIDQTDLCDIQFGTIVNRSPVVIAISTDGPGCPLVDNGAYKVQPVPEPSEPGSPSTNRDVISSAKEAGSSQNDILFMRGNAMSGAPIISGTNQLPKPPIIAGITMKKIMIRP